MIIQNSVVRLFQSGLPLGLVRTTTGSSEDTNDSSTQPSTNLPVPPSTIDTLGRYRILDFADQQMQRHPLEVPPNVEIKIGEIHDFSLADGSSVKLHFGLYEYEGDKTREEKDAAVWVVSAFERLDQPTIETNQATFIKQLADHVNSWGIVRNAERANPHENHATDPRLRVWIARLPDALLQGASRVARPYPDLTSQTKPTDKFDNFMRNVLCKMHRDLDNVRIHGDTLWTITQHVYWEQQNIKKTEIPLHERLTMRELIGNVQTSKTIIHPISGAEVNAKEYILRRIAYETGYTKQDGSPANLQWFLGAIQDFTTTWKHKVVNDTEYIQSNLTSSRVKPQDQLRADETTDQERKFNYKQLANAIERLDIFHDLLIKHFGISFDDHDGLSLNPIEPHTTIRDIENDHEFEYNLLISDEGELREQTSNERLIELEKPFNGGFSVMLDLLNSSFGMKFYDPQTREEIPLFVHQYRRLTPFHRTMFYMPQRNVDTGSVRSPYFSKKPEKA